MRRSGVDMQSVIGCDWADQYYTTIQDLQGHSVCKYPKAAKWGVASQVALGDAVQYCQCSVAVVQHMHSAAAAIEGERGTVGGLGRRLQ